MVRCLQCHAVLELKRVCCPACGLAYEGQFRVPRLARLTTEQQRTVEELVLSHGNLKAVAEAFDISYPTLRKRLGELSAALAELRQQDETATEQLLDRVAKKQVAPETAARLIREMSGGT